MPDVASSSSELSEYDFDPPDDPDVESDAPEEKEVEFPKAAPRRPVANKALKRTPSKFQPVDSD